MRVGLFHNRYLQRGGEDGVVDLTADLLSKDGHEVRTFFVDNREAIGERAIGAVRAGLTARWNSSAAAAVAAFVDENPIDVAHVHNTFPLLSPAIFGPLRERGIPVVVTLHNYRLLCANGLFYRDGGPCEECVERGPWHAVRFGCYRGSRLQTAVWSEASAYHERRGTWRDEVTLFTTPSEFARAKLWSAGLPVTRVQVVPNPVLDPGPPAPGGVGGVFVGRLSHEKGVGLLLEAWRRLGDTPLTIVGTGPEEEALRRRAASLPSVRFTGELPRDAVDAELARAAFAVAPSCWYETFGMSVAEAMANGTAVVAPRDTALCELVDAGRTGLVFDRGDAPGLAEACLALRADPERTRFMGAEARAAYEEQLAPERSIARLVGVYEDALRTGSRDSGGRARGTR